MLGTSLDFFKTFLSQSKNAKNLYDRLSDPVTFLDDASKGQSEEFRKLLNYTLPCMVNVTQENITAPVNDVVVKIFKDCIWPMFTTSEVKVIVRLKDCNVNEEEAVIKTLLTSFSVLLLIILSCCCKSRKSFKTSCCWGRPAPVVPLNMLDNYKNRHGYMLAFGVTVNSCLDVLFGDYDKILGAKAAAEIRRYPGYLSVIVKINLAILICIIAYPFFIAQNMKNRLLGSILGLVYSFAYFALLIDKHVKASRKCWPIFDQNNTRRLGTIMIMEDLPRLACLVALMVYFSGIFFLIVYKRYKDNRQTNYIFQEDEEDWKQEYTYIHVKHVFEKHLIEKKLAEEKQMTSINTEIV